MLIAIELLDFDGRVCFLEGGKTVPITNFFDEDGDECEPDDAVACIAGSNEFGWLTINLGEFEQPTVH